MRALIKAWRADPETLIGTIQSLNKLLDLDLAVILEAYQTESLMRQQRADQLRSEIEHVAERRRMVEEKLRTESVFRNLVEAAQCMIVILRRGHGIAYFSPFAEQLTGYTADEVIGKDYFPIFLPRAEQSGMQQSMQRIFSGTPVSGYQSEVLCRDGTCRMLLWNARLLEDYADGPAVLAVGQDITCLNEAQEKLVQAERLAAIGQMVAGLAHESRNALQRRFPAVIFATCSGARVWGWFGLKCSH